MAKIKFENGTVVNFNGNPTPKDVEEVASRLGLQKKVSPFNPNAQNSQFVQPTPAGATEMKYSKSDNTGVLGKFFKELPKATLETAVGQPVKLMTSAAEGLVQTIKTGENASGKTYDLPGLTPFKSFQSEAIDRTTAGQGKLKNILQGSFEVGMAGLDTIGLAKAGIKAVSTGKKAITTLATKQAERKAASTFKEVLDVVKPKLTATEEAAAKAQGRGSLKGLFNKVDIAPSERDIEITKVAQEAGVKAGKGFDTNIKVMKEAQKNSANLVRQGLKDSKAIWNKNELKGTLNQVELPISLTQPDLPIAGKLKSGIMKLVDDAPKTPDGILDVRQKFDNLVEQNFGKIIFAKDDPKGILIRKLRQALNDFAESKLPDGQLPNGSTLKTELRRQHLLYDAIDNVAEKAPKAGTNAFGRLLEKHPTLKKAVKWGALGLGGSGIIKGFSD
jgi:hypothetical protein